MWHDSAEAHEQAQIPVNPTPVTQATIFNLENNFSLVITVI